MKRLKAASALLLALALHSRAKAAEPSEPSEPPEPTEPVSRRVDLGVELWLLYSDVDGPGGFSNREADPIRPTSRSPSLSIERALLNVVGHATPWLHARMRLRASDSRAFVDRGYVEAEAIENQLRLQLGLNKPLQYVERRTFTYSALQTAFWRNIQYHAAADFRWPGVVEPRITPSVAWQRPLHDDFPSQDEAFGMISFGDADAGESNPLEYGGLASLSGFGATVGGFGFMGQLRDNEDVLYLQRIFANYELAGDPNSRTSRWYGLRGSFDRWGLFLHGERIWARQGLLNREALEATASYTVSLPLAGRQPEIEPIVRYSEVAITNFPEEYAIPQTWDRTQWLFGALIRPIPMVELKVERVLLRERAGVSREGKTRVANDEWAAVLQLEISDEDLE